MTNWQISIPYRSRSDDLLDIADAARSLPTDEARTTVRQLVLGAATDGVRSAGELIDFVDRLTPAERRALLDRTRQAAGLASIAAVEARERRKYHAPMTGVEQRDADGKAHMICPATGCKTFPVNEVGAPVARRERRWWCPRHQHLAPAEDMQAWSPGIRLGPGGFVIADEEKAERQRLEREAERYQAQREQRQAAALAQLPTVEAERHAEAAAWRPDNMIGDTS